VSVDTIVGLIFGAGGIGSVGGFIKYRDWARKNKLAIEDTSITRLQDENKAARARADKAEQDEDSMRDQRDSWRELAALYRSRLIQANLLNPSDEPWPKG
jgi:hypothetical protein